MVDNYVGAVAVALLIRRRKPASGEPLCGGRMIEWASGDLMDL